MPKVAHAPLAARRRPHLGPDAPENLEKPSGRGLLLMRHYLSTMTFNRRGNVVTLCRCRSEGR
jgi:hypothetical protein